MTGKNAKTNTSNVSKKAKIILFASLAVAMSVAFVNMTPVFAHDSNGDIMDDNPFSPSASETIWYNMNALDDVTFGGSEDNSAAVKLVSEVPRYTVHSTDFDLTVISTNNHGYNSRVDATYLGGTNVLGATGTYTGGGGQYKVIWLNTNDNLDYDLSVGCNLSYGEVNPDYVLTHEFGHLAGLDHHTWHWGAWSGHTAMNPGCNHDQAQLRAEDLNDINEYYS